MKTLNLMDVKEEDVLSRNEMKHIMAGSGGGYACQYLVSGSWTGILNGCSTTTYTGGGSIGGGGVSGSGSVSTTEETCCYDAYDPYDMGFSGEKCINGAKARQC